MIDNIFEESRDNAFKKIFQGKLAGGMPTRMRVKAFSIAPDASAARKGKNIARAISGDMKHDYIAMAAKRRRKLIEQ